MPDFENEVRAIRSRTADYSNDAEFRREWRGLTEQSANYRAQQIRAFGILLGSVTSTLEGWKILDVGCGNGFWLRNCIELDASPQDLVGIDVSDARFAEARAKNPLINFLQTDGVTIPFEDGHFDLVTQFVAFSTMPSAALRMRIAGEISRVLKPGGYVFWWDHLTGAETNIERSLRPSDFFSWPSREWTIGPLPRPSESVRLPEKLGGFLAGLDRLGFPATHWAALIGPKP